MNENENEEKQKVTTHIDIKLTIPVSEDDSVDPKSMMEVTINHEDCGNKKLDKIADDFCAVLSFFVDNLKGNVI